MALIEYDSAITRQLRVYTRSEPTTDCREGSKQGEGISILLTWKRGTKGKHKNQIINWIRN